MEKKEGEKLSLAAKIAKVSAEVGAIAKDGHNTEQGYAFIEYAAVAARIREIQEKVGIAIVPHVESYTKDEVKNKWGTTGYHYLVNMIFTVMNTEDVEDQFEVKWVGESIDFGDKGINKAETSGVKYFIMRLYNISEKSEKEADADSPQVRSEGKEQKAANTTDSRSNSRSMPVTKPNEIFCVKVRSQLPLKKTNEELEGYWKELKLSKKYQEILQPFFAKRRKEINDATAKTNG